MKRFWAAVALGLCLAGSGADAAIFQTTFTGTIVSGNDDTGVFGTPNADYVGQSFVATYVFDNSLGNHVPNAVGEALFSGDQFGTPTALVSATFELNGHTVSFDGNWYAIANALSNQNGHYLIMDTPPTPTFAHGMDNQLGVPFPVDVGVPFSATGHGGGGISYFDPGQSATFNFDTTSIDVRILGGAVPEPQTWAMLIVGFSLCGAFARATRSGHPAP